MARMLGPDNAQRLVIGSDWKGSPVTYAGRTATVYTTSGATVLASIAAYDGTETPGSVISGSTLTIGTDGRLPLFWLPDGADDVYVKVVGLQGTWHVSADWDARIGVLTGMTQAAAVADQAALTASAPAALTAVAAAGDAPDDDEFDALLADVTALRTTVAAVVVDLAAARTKTNALLASLRTAELLDT